MQPVNNNMDDLFRRAAENYPLKPEGADWNKVLELLQADKGVPKDGNRNYYLWLLVLVLPLTFLYHNVKKDDNESKYIAKSHQVHRQYKGSKGETVSKVENMGVKNGNKQVKEYPVDQKKTSPGVEAESLKAQKIPQRTLPAAGRFSSKKGVNEYTESSPENFATTNKTVKSKSGYSTSPVNSHTNNKEKIPNDMATAGKGYPVHLFTGKRVNAVEEMTNPAENSSGNKKIFKGNKRNKESKKEAGVLSKTFKVKKESGETEEVIKANPVLQPGRQRAALPGVIAADFAKKEMKTMLDKQLADSIKRAEVPEPALNQVRIKQKKLYAGILAGPDVSRVKNDMIQGAGYSFGLVAGFRYNKRLSIEAGMLWDEKKYYSEGSYFNTDKMKLPPHTTVIDGHGTCNMIEIPLTVRYTFAYPTRHSNWFASAGTSSYLMKKEDYHYWYKRYGTRYYAQKIYRNSSNNWFSIIHISAGYQKKMKHIGDVRIEPYFKLPLKGVGIGSLPISSGGIYFVITRPIR